jgi:hypothetical protein
VAQKHLRECLAGVLAALVGIEYLRLSPPGNGLLNGFDDLDRLKQWPQVEPITDDEFNGRPVCKKI